MKPGRIVLWGVGLLAVGLGAVALSVAPAGAQGFGGSQAPSSSVAITSAPRLDVSATTAPGVFLAVAGDSDGARLEVALQSGTVVNLTPETYSLLAGDRTCVDYPVGNNVVSSSVFTFPEVAGQQSASITVHNFGVSVDYVACFRGWMPDGGPAPSCAVDAGAANIPLHDGDTWVVDGLADAHRLRCLTCTHAGPPSGGTVHAGGSVSICTPSL